MFVYQGSGRNGTKKIYIVHESNLDRNGWGSSDMHDVGG